MDEKDPILAKISIIKNCLQSIRSATKLDPDVLDDQFTQDVFVLNLQRACQAAIDMAQLLIAYRGLELPRSYKHSFDILCRNQLLTSAIAERMSKMAGFRNIAIHDYQALNPDILKAILVKHLEDFEHYSTAVYTLIHSGDSP